MGLWMKDENGNAILVTSGPDTTGDHDHEDYLVLEGDPTDPTILAVWEEGQLLFDGEQGSNGVDGPHTHTDYIRITGGTMIGDLSFSSSTGVLSPSRIYSLKNDLNPRSGLVVRSSDDDNSARLVMYGGGDPLSAGTAMLKMGDYESQEWTSAGTTIGRDLTVGGDASIGGHISIVGDTTLDGNIDISGDIYGDVTFVERLPVEGEDAVYSSDVTIKGSAERGFAIDLRENANIDALVRLLSSYSYDDNSTLKNYLDVRVGDGEPESSVARFREDKIVEIHGQVIAPNIRFGIPNGIDTSDILDRAETATMPDLNDEDVVASGDGLITVNEVMAAMLAKIKELSARIEELEGN
jgi:hypothetical protein